MQVKIALFAASFLLPILVVPAFSADADPTVTTRKPAVSRQDDGRFTIVNMTQSQIVRTRFGDAAPVDLVHPIGPGESGRLDPAISGKACGNTAIVITFDDDIDVEGSADLCVVKKLTLHGDTAAQ